MDTKTQNKTTSAFFVQAAISFGVLFAAEWGDLSQLLGRPVRMTGDALGPGVQVAIDKLRPGDLLMLENLRFHAEEEANGEEFSKALAGLADVYVDDAFGSAHRAHASTEGITHFLPSVAGLLMERELEYLGRTLEKPKRPFVAILAYRTTDGGQTWTALNTLPSHFVDFVDANHGWLATIGGTGFRTTNGGATWTPMTLGPASPLPATTVRLPSSSRRTTRFAVGHAR